MASAIDLSGLKHYMESIERYAKALKDFHGAMEDICKSACEFATKKYGEHGHSNITLKYSNKGKTATIYAHGTAVAFFEFGTGEYAKGTYQGNLPEIGVPITGKWEYYYDSEAKTTDANGVKGWFWGKTFVKGNPAEAEMWETSQYIKQKAKTIMNAYFKAESGG